MAAKGYQFFIVHEFPQLEIGELPIKTIQQQALLPEERENMPATEISAVGIADSPQFLKYFVRHESYLKVRGRYMNQPITQIVAWHDFHIYMHHEKQIMFVDVARAISKEMVNRVSESRADFRVSESRIDLARLGLDLKDRIRGGWFGNLMISDVSTIGLFGLTVGMSQEWETYEQVGQLKSIDVELEDTSGARHLVKIGANRSVVLYSSFPEADALNFVLALQEDTLRAYELAE